MISKILPIVALTGAAMAGCPLSVAIVDTASHVATVAVTNTGSEAITVFKGNTVLDSAPTLDVFVEDAEGTSLPFGGMYVNYKRSGLSAASFQTLQAGETVTATVNVAKTYKLAGLAKAQITAVQGFSYVTGTVAPTALKDMTICEDVSSETVTISPDQSLVVDEHLVKREDEAFFSRVAKRDVTFSSCSTAQTTSLKTTVADAISLATGAYTGAASYADYYTTWFIAKSTLTKVQSIYTKVKNVETTSPKISCTDTYGDCSSGDALLYTVPSANVIVPCPSNGYWAFPELVTSCTNFDYDKGGSLLHEMTHLYGTDDYAYGPTAAKKLTAAKAAANADTYEMYSNSVRLGGCTDG